MYRFSDAFIQAQADGQAPVALAFISSPMGIRVYGKQTPTDEQIGSVAEAQIADGSIIANGTHTAGSGNRIIDRGARVLSFPSIRETLTPKPEQLLLSLKATEMSEYSVLLNNADRYFSKILALDFFMGQTLEIRLGFRGIAYIEFASVFMGKIRDETLDGTTFEIRAVAEG